MNFETQRQTILDQFKDEWEVGSFLPVDWPNQPFKQPSSPWCRFSIQLAGRENASVGTGHMRIRGVAFLQIFLPKNSGTKAGMEAADRFTQIFDNRTIGFENGDIQFDAAAVEEPGEQRDGQYMILCTCPFYTDTYDTAD